ncbi:hypothetical protein Tco_0706348 [Tanacetum coccineum]|uniref:Uncharacterized protein n=1 Tax=Tanacetum coccineum TaxID=301880 RepID=A0ABQ4Y8Q6_9ASTR
MSTYGFYPCFQCGRTNEFPHCPCSTCARCGSNLVNGDCFNCSTYSSANNYSPNLYTTPPHFSDYSCHNGEGNTPHDSQTLPQQYLVCAYCGGPHFDYQCQPINQEYYNSHSSGFDHPQPPQDSVDHQGILQILNKLEEKFEEIIRDGRKKIEDMSIEEMMHEQQLVDREIKEIINDLGYKRFRGEEIDKEYERDCEIRIQKLKQDFNIWGSEVRKKEKAYEDEKYAAACRYMLSVTCDDDDDDNPSRVYS